MKKTMFITSVIMVVVMAIALTTSSLAWFTANGSNTIRAAQLTIRAEATTSSGIQISKTDIPTDGGYLWRTDCTFDASSDLLPLVPKTNTASASITAEDIGEAISSLDFIGARIGSNGKFTGVGGDDNGTSTVYNDGYYTDDIWVTNIASGAGAASIQIAPTIFFGTRGATADADVAYSDDGDDATLCVAVFAWSGEVDPTTGADPTSSSEAWELLAYKDSQGNTGAAVKVGCEDAKFAPGQIIGNATASKSVSGIITTNNKTTVELPPISGTAGDTYETMGGVAHLRIVAWYDGTTLITKNSNTSIPFYITFTASNVA